MVVAPLRQLVRMDRRATVSRWVRVLGECVNLLVRCWLLRSRVWCRLWFLLLNHRLHCRFANLRRRRRRCRRLPTNRSPFLLIRRDRPGVHQSYRPRPVALPTADRMAAVREGIL